MKLATHLHIVSRSRMVEFRQFCHVFLIVNIHIYMRNQIVSALSDPPIAPVMEISLIIGYCVFFGKWRDKQ
jgi:hypothetical protein